MKILCLGGAGRICRESVKDLVETSDFERITVADLNEAAGREVVSWVDDPRVDFQTVNVRETEKTVEMMAAYDVVMDGLPISLNDASAACAAKAGVHGINLNGMSREWDLDPVFKRAGKTYVPGCGMTPGVTNLMAMHGASRLEKVDEVYCSHGAFRPIAFSEAIAETTRIEYDANLTSRVVFEDGEFLQVPPFGRPKTITLPEPFGTHEQYIIPHPEPLTLSKSLAHKGVRLIEARGTWPPPNMRLLRSLHEFGFLRNDSIDVSGGRIGILDAIARYLVQSPEGSTTELYGYALHVEVVGEREGRRFRHVFTNSHPSSDGSVADWAGLRAYTRSVGIPLSIGAQLIAKGAAHRAGAVAPENAFEPQAFFQELKKRRIFVNERVLQG